MTDRRHRLAVLVSLNQKEKSVSWLYMHNIEYTCTLFSDFECNRFIDSITKYIVQSISSQYTKD